MAGLGQVQREKYEYIYLYTADKHYFTRPIDNLNAPSADL